MGEVCPRVAEKATSSDFLDKKQDITMINAYLSCFKKIKTLKI